MEHSEAFSRITFEYNTGPIPPPFCHRYKIEISKNNAEEYKLDLEIEYYDRDEITEEEIFEEGFSLDDDYSWTGNLPRIWGQEVEKKLKLTNWRKKISRSEDDSEFIIKITDNYQSEVLQPAIIRPWEIFVQEIIQAVFEMNKREAPLQISFLPGNSNNLNQKIDFTFSFASRNFLVNSSGIDNKSMDWTEGQKLLKFIFRIDYLPENGFEKIPETPGNYISPGDGLWYELAPFEHANKEAIAKLKQLIETLESYG